MKRSPHRISREIAASILFLCSGSGKESSVSVLRRGSHTITTCTETETSITHTLQAKKRKIVLNYQNKYHICIKNIHKYAKILEVFKHYLCSTIMYHLSYPLSRSYCPCFRDNWQPVGRIWYQIVWSSSFPSTLSKLTWLSAAAAACLVHQAAEAM